MTTKCKSCGSDDLHTSDQCQDCYEFSCDVASVQDDSDKQICPKCGTYCYGDCMAN